MMKTILTIILVLSTLQVSASPEEMYGSYDKDGKYRAMQEQMDRINRQVEEAERVKHENMMLALGISTLVGLVPVVVIGRKIIKGRSWETNPSGMWQALGIAFAGGVVLFAFNFLFFYLRFMYNKEFSKFGPVVIGLIIILGAIILLKWTKSRK